MIKCTLFNFITVVILTASLHSNGQSLDNSFGSGGIVTGTLGTAPFLQHVGKVAKLQSDGKILVGANYDLLALNPDFKIIRYNTNGTVDNAFGVAGIASSGIIGNTYACNDLLIQPDGKIVVAGYVEYGNLTWDIMLTRYESNGTLDNTFGTNGHVFTSILLASGSGAQANRIAIQPDGKLIICGWAEYDFNMREHLIIRYLTNGTIDNSFGANGKFLYSPFNSQDETNDVKIQPDGKIVFVGYTIVTDFDVLVGRVDSNGILDNTFGTAGITTININADDEAQNLLIESSGKIVVSGITFDFNGTTNFDNFIARLNSNGVLDNTFNSTGIHVLDINTSDNLAWGIAQQTDGKFITSGEAASTGFGLPEICLIRFNNSGTIDLTFGTNGYFISPIPAGAPSSALDVLIQPDSKIVIAGVYTDNANIDDGMVVCRYNNTIGTSISETASEPLEFHFFPNPFNQKINITSLHHIGIVELFNTMGVLLISQRGNEETNVIQTTDLPTGVYQIKIITNEQIVTKKLIKN